MSNKKNVFQYHYFYKHKKHIIKKKFHNPHEGSELDVDKLCEGYVSVKYTLILK